MELLGAAVKSFLKVTYLMRQDSCPVRRTCPRNK